MKSFLFLALILATTCMQGEQFIDEAPANADITYDFEFCDDGSWFTINSLEIVPETFAKGDEVTVNLVATALKEVTLEKGVVTLSGAEIYKLELGDHLAGGQEYEFSKSGTIPFFTPKGEYDATIKVYSTEGTVVLCVNGHIVIP